MREIKISIETAQRWANGTDEELKVLALQTYPELAKKELPKTWEELEIINGYSNLNTDICFNNYKTSNCKNKNIFATKEQAEASIAIAQLSQLREVYRNGWVPDWSDDELKYCIEFYQDKINTRDYMYFSLFLSFQDAKTRDLFLENFRELIERAKLLMS